MKMLNKTKIVRLPFLGDLAVSFGRTVFGIVLGLIASAVLIGISGVNPFVAYGALIRGAFGNGQAPVSSTHLDVYKRQPSGPPSSVLSPE